MGRTISFKVFAIPVAQPRQRHSVMAAGGKSFVRNYTPKNAPVNAFKAAVFDSAARAYSGPPLDGPLALRVVFVFPRPQGMRWKTKAMPRALHCKKPDTDNLLKSLTDAINGTLVVDDAQFCQVTAQKFIAAGSEQPHCEVNIAQIDEGER